MIFAYKASVAVASDGSATVYLGQKIRGRVHAIKWVNAASQTAAPMVITGETTGVPILTKDVGGDGTTVWYYPRAACNNVADGAASTLTEDYVQLLAERIKVVVASGTEKTGTITIYVDE